MVANETWDASLVGIVSRSIISIQTCEISQNTAPEILRNAGKLIGYNMFLFQVCYFYVLHGLPNHQQIWSTLISTVFVSVHRFKPGFKTILKRCIFTSKLILWPFGSLEWPRYTEFVIVKAACKGNASQNLTLTRKNWISGYRSPKGFPSSSCCGIHGSEKEKLKRENSRTRVALAWTSFFNTLVKSFCLFPPRYSSVDPCEICSKPPNSLSASLAI